jgi:hypothetical protein
MVFEVVSLRQPVFRPLRRRPLPPARRRPSAVIYSGVSPTLQSPPRPVPPGITVASPVTDRRTSPRMSPVPTDPQWRVVTVRAVRGLGLGTFVYDAALPKILLMIV